MIQRSLCFFLLYVANDRLISSFRYVTIGRHFDTTFALCQPSEMSQYAVTMIQGSHCVNLPRRHNMPSFWYNVRIVSTFRDVTICRHYDTTFAFVSTFRDVTICRHFNTTFALFQPSETSQYAVTIYMIQRSHCVNNMPSLWYNVRIVPTFRDVTICRHFDTTFALCQPSETS